MKLQNFNDFINESNLIIENIFRISIPTKDKDGIKRIEDLLRGSSYEKEVSGKNTEFMLPYGDPRELKMLMSIEKELPKGASINEAKRTLKRRYTESHPAKKMYSGAKVRAAIFDAVKDGVITEDEIKKILKEMGADERWHKRHSYFFDISEDGKYCLSQKGIKVYKKVHE